MVKVIERGWPGHFICADRCLFRRNTLIEGAKDMVIVTTVGNMHSHGKVQTIGGGDRYYETMVFGVKKKGPYLVANVADEREFEGQWSICAESVSGLPDGVANVANDMHEAVVKKFMNKLASSWS